MADMVKARGTGLSATVSSGAKVFGSLSEDGKSVCFRLTSPSGKVTEFALSDEAISAMLAIAARLRAENAEA